MKVQNPIIGRSRGSAGGMTFAKVYDKNVVRAKAFEVNNPKTTAQTTQRNYFKELSALVATFTEEQLRFLFPNKPKAMSRRNALAKQLAKYFTINAGVKSVDYATIDTIGNASTFDIVLPVTSVTEQGITVDCEQLLVQFPEYEKNYVCILAINVTKKTMSLQISENTLEGESITVEMPSGWEAADTIHAFPLVSNMVTQPTGFGTMYVVKRPAKQEA